MLCLFYQIPFFFAKVSVVIECTLSLGNDQYTSNRTLGHSPIGHHLIVDSLVNFLCWWRHRSSRLSLLRLNSAAIDHPIFQKFVHFQRHLLLSLTCNSETISQLTFFVDDPLWHLLYGHSFYVRLRIYRLTLICWINAKYLHLQMHVFLQTN